MTLVFLGIPLPCFPSWALCSSGGSESEVPGGGGMGLSCRDIQFWEVCVQRDPGRGFFPGRCHTPWVLTPFPGCPQSWLVAKWPHLQLQLPTFPSYKSREYSRAPLLALSGIPNGTGNLGMGCASLSGMLCPASPFPLALPLWKSPSCLSPVPHPVLGQLRAGYLRINFLLDPNCLLRAEAFGIFGRISPSREL